MSTAIKTLVYILLMTAMYCEEHDVPVMLYVKRGVFISRWKFAAWAQRGALNSYHSYMEEVEIAHG